MEEYVKVRLAVIVKKEEKVLLGKRNKSPGDRCWDLPSRYQDFGETPYHSASKEMKEIGLNVAFVSDEPFGSTDDYFEREKEHYHTFYFEARCINPFSEPRKPNEDDECEKWNWFRWDELPKPLFLSVKNLLKKGYNPFV